MAGFRTWVRSRPAIGGLLVALSGIELFFSGQLDIGKFHVQLGIEGLQATIVPIALVALGLLAMFMPVHHIFYGVIALALAVYSLIGVNLGGFIIGMLLGAVGGVLVVAWMPKTVVSEEPPEDSVDISAEDAVHSVDAGDSVDADDSLDAFDSLGGSSEEEFDIFDDHVLAAKESDDSHDEDADEGAKRPLARGRR